MGLEKVSIAVKTFLRDEKLFHALEGIVRTMPEVTIIVADDGEQSRTKDQVYKRLLRPKDTLLEMAFDSGFGYKSNRIVEANKNPYLLIGSDDFDFGGEGVRAGIEKMAQVLDLANIDIAGGRVFGPYEFHLKEEDGVVTEIPLNTNVQPQPWYFDCGLTVNYCLIRASILGFGPNQVHWDDDVKIGGGEHGAFFVDVKRAGYRVAYVPGVSISEIKGADSERYRQFRARNSGADRPCFVRRGIRKYVLGNGRLDYEEKA